MVPVELQAILGPRAGVLASQVYFGGPVVMTIRGKARSASESRLEHLVRIVHQARHASVLF